MSDYDWKINTEAKRKLIEGRCLKLAQDGYQLELNYKFAVSQENQEEAEKYKKAIDAIKASLDFHIAELNSLSQ